MIKEIIIGKVPSKSNSYKIIKKDGKFSLAKKPALINYENAFGYQCHSKNLMITGRFIFTADIFYEDNRPDLDNSFKILLDCLQKFNVIKNDRSCVEIVARKHIDKKNPRVEFTIKELQ